MPENIRRQFEVFLKESRFFEKGAKGPLCVGLTVTRHAVKNGLPIDAASLLTKKGGQVSILGRALVQSILLEYGISQVLAEEGGRTSRGSIGNMQIYVEFLNTLNPDADGLKILEAIWIERIRAFFAGKPFKLHFDSSQSMRAVIKDLLSQVEKRQKETQGATLVGTVLQHLTGAKLDVLTEGNIVHHGANVADEQSGRPGDFLLDDVAIHVTVTPGEAVMRKCRQNLESGLRPIVMSRGRGIQVAEGLAEQAGILDRIDIFDAEQFLAENFYELGKFFKKERELTARRIIEKYNEIVDTHETDPSLKVEI
jgi:hypothetical protein